MARNESLFGIHGTALALRSQRLSMLASNIANAATPGYKARDIDFAAVLKDAASAQGKPQLPAKPGENAPLNAETLYRSAVQRSIDGNTVDLDVERAQFADNAVRYEAQLMFINSRIRSMLAAIQG